jgi:glycerophosphoryl diester phosphodiesterase
VADGAEVDVLVTSDGEAVLRHDERLADGTPVRALSLAELRARTGGDADDLPEVGTVLEAVRGKGTLNLELKVPGAARALRPFAPLPDGVVLTSFYRAEVAEALAAFPGTRVGLLLSRWPAAIVPTGTHLLSVLHALLARARAEFPAATLWAWTVNDEAAAREARAARCEAWIGDDVDLLRRLAGA